MTNPKFNQSKFDQNKAIMEMFIDNTKTYIQLGSAALGAVLVFGEKIKLKESPTSQTALALLLILISIGSGAAYQYYAVKNVDQFSLIPDEVYFFKKFQDKFIKSPGYLYGTMLLTFYAGFFLLTVSVLWSLFIQK